MKLALRLALAGLAAGLVTGASSAAGAAPRIVEAGSTYPERSYVLTLPAPRSLAPSQVHVTENGQPVADLSLVRQGTAAGRSAVVLDLDESLTMKGKPIAGALAAARAFAASASSDEQVAVVTFNGTVDVLQGFTSSVSSLDRALAERPAIGYGTKNYDALQRSLELLEGEKVASGSIIMLTDGQSVGSVAKAGPVLSALARAHVRVFTVGLASPAFRPAALERIAAATGGAYVQASGPAALGPILVKLGRRLSSEYLLSYRSRANPRTRVRVEVSVAGVAGVGTDTYTTPALHLTPAGPYRPSLVGRAIQSAYTMIAVALLFVGLLAWSIIHIVEGKVEPLVDRISGFVSIQRSATAEAPAPRQSLFGRMASLDRGGDAGRRDWYQRLAAALDLADLRIGPYRLLVYATAGAVLVAIVLIALFGPIGILFALAVPLALRMLIVTRIKLRRRAFAEQLPDNLDVLASSLRAGHSLVGALNVVADNASEPSKSEFQRVLAEEQFGAALEDAFQVAVRRMENADLDQVALIAMLQREMGANAAEVLDQVVENVRSRMELRRLIGSLTAQGRLSRWILTLLPVGLALMMTLVDSSYMHPLFHRPLGLLLLLLAAGMVSLGSWLIGRIVNIRLA